MAKRIVRAFYNDMYYKYVPLRKLDSEERIIGQIRVWNADGFLADLQNAFPDIEPVEGYVEENNIISIIFPIRIHKKLFSYVRKKGFYLDYPRYLVVKQEIPGGYLYSGWGTGRKTRILPEDLPPSYIRLYNYKKSGYLQTACVKDIFYRPSRFHNHSYKDDFLFLSYKEPFKEGCDWFQIKDAFTEYVFGNDIVDVVFGVEKYSPDLKEKTDAIKARMVEQYNLYVDEIERLGWREHPKKIVCLEELLSSTKEKE